MTNFIENDIPNFTSKPFQIFNDEWTLISAAKPDGSVNAMTASWGGLGTMWHKPVTSIVLRPQRYTKEFIESSGLYALNFFDKSFKKTLTYFGTVSGKEENKIEKSGLQIEYYQNMPIFKEAKLVILCQALFQQEMKGEGFLSKAIEKEHYKNKDYHYLYFGEVTKLLTK